MAATVEFPSHSPTVWSLSTETTDDQNAGHSTGSVFVIVGIVTLGMFALIFLAVASVGYQMIKRKRRRALSFQARLDSITNSNVVMRVVPSPLETLAMRRAQSDSYISMQSVYNRSRVLDEGDYEDIVPYSGVTKAAVRAKYRRWSSCSSDAYLNEFDGPPASTALKFLRQRSEPALFSTTLPARLFPRPPPPLPPRRVFSPPPYSAPAALSRSFISLGGSPPPFPLPSSVLLQHVATLPCISSPPPLPSRPPPTLPPYQLPPPLPPRSFTSQAAKPAFPHHWSTDSY